MKQPTLKSFGDSAILLEWENTISNDIHKDVLRAQTLLKDVLGDQLLEIVPAYASMALYFNRQVSVDKVKNEIEQLLQKESEATALEREKIKIPVCYDEAFAPDIQELVEKKNISIDALITLHTQPTYTVYFLGFLPGFPYLGGLDSKLHHPRKSTPRKKVEAGSVGIAGGQTGIYPSNSPGGWNIIGRTPLALFSVEKQPPSLLKAGNLLQFESISAKEYESIIEKVRSGDYKIKKEIIHG
ncbi:5-oxoprolinase subunit PxpB [Luteirhabdus pelagi]|uniref:5-oxoprolinase subunit PxpB n=1 Tax=Luteirhabdus pelagi TaxID=2792783 RepID=UPI0019399485|nr:5-oxoprolinase subunit PxpB [Luteirhabdus pelagi]